jgi:hypothetical protein
MLVSATHVAAAVKDSVVCAVSAVAVVVVLSAETLTVSV